MEKVHEFKYFGSPVRNNRECGKDRVEWVKKIVRNL